MWLVWNNDEFAYYGQNDDVVYEMGWWLCRTERDWIRVVLVGQWSITNCFEDWLMCAR